MTDRSQPALPVLMYHSIDRSRSAISIAPDAFRRHMRTLSAAGWRTLTVRDTIAGITAGGWPSRSFLLTFDDGYRSVVEDAAPEMQNCGFQGVVFVISGRAGMDNRWAGQPSWVPELPLLDWPAVRSLIAAGWDVGAHSRSHRRLTAINSADAEREIADSRREIEDRCGVAVETFAYPYGASSPAIAAIAARHFTAAFGNRLAYITSRSNRLELERLDAYYMRSLPALPKLDGIALRSYFAVRRAVRALRA